MGIVGAATGQELAMQRALRHRGPDADGVTWIPELSTALAHVRLSIIDLDARANQPFHSSCGRFSIVFNGEIYNYRELRERLESGGVSFRTQSDTEVLLEWLRVKGPDGLGDVDGMFAFCIADRLARRLILARDHIGEKPLYFVTPSGRNGSFAFASEIKALLTLDGLDTSLDPTALRDYLRFLYVAPPHTIFAGISELRPGHTLTVDLRTEPPGVCIRRFYDLESRSSGPGPRNYTEAIDQFRDCFRRSVSLRLRSDVPVGLYLSGGLDSNSILAVAHELSPTSALRTFTARYDGGDHAGAFDEGDLARAAAAYQGATNQSIPFHTPESLLESIEGIQQLFDEPFGNATAVVSERIAASASSETKVCLTGDGGDELLAGYPRYKALGLHRSLDWIPSSALVVANQAASRLGERGKFATPIRRLKHFTRTLGRSLAESFIDWSTYTDSAALARATGRSSHTEFYGDLVGLFERNQSDLLRAAGLVDMLSFVPHNLLRCADRTSMAHSLELRVPFLAPSLVETALRIPERLKLVRRGNKPLLVDSFSSILPRSIRCQPKRAFNPPIRDYMRRQLDDVVWFITGPAAHLRDVVDGHFVTEQIQAFRDGRRDNSTFLWGLASLECWLRSSRGRVSELRRRRLC